MSHSNCLVSWPTVLACLSWGYYFLSRVYHMHSTLPTIYPPILYLLCYRGDSFREDFARLGELRRILPPTEIPSCTTQHWPNQCGILLWRWWICSKWVVWIKHQIWYSWCRSRSLNSNIWLLCVPCLLMINAAF